MLDMCVGGWVDGDGATKTCLSIQDFLCISALGRSRREVLCPVDYCPYRFSYCGLSPDCRVSRPAWLRLIMYEYVSTIGSTRDLLWIAGY